MKKQVLILLLVIILAVGLFILSGCVSKENEEKTKTENETIQVTPDVVDDSLVKINDLEFHLDKETTFKDMNYTIVSDFKEANMDRYVQYNYYQEDSTNLLFFRIFHYEGKSVEEIIQDLGIQGEVNFIDGKTDNIEYKYYPQPREDGGTIHFYFIDKDDSTYVLNFTSKYDLKDFEDKVVKTIKF